MTILTGGDVVEGERAHLTSFSFQNRNLAIRVGFGSVFWQYYRLIPANKLKAELGKVEEPSGQNCRTTPRGPRRPEIAKTTILPRTTCTAQLGKYVQN